MISPVVPASRLAPCKIDREVVLVLVIITATEHHILSPLKSIHIWVGYGGRYKYTEKN